MTKLQDIVDTIREIECPVDQWQDKVMEAFKEYACDDEYDIAIDREENLDFEGVKAYSVHCNDPEQDEIVVLVSEGSEHYVANVEDAYIRQSME